MGLISIIISLFGGFIIWYDMTPLPHDIAQQWVMIGGGFLFGIPAAIGCGEQRFDQLVKANQGILIVR